MDPNLQSCLKKYGIQYKTYKHIPVFTVEESKNIKAKIPGKHTKCLFLKDNNGQFYLIALPAQKRLNTKTLRKKLNVKKLNFGSPEELKKELNLTPGSVSIFGMIYSSSVFLIIDKELWDAEITGFHPNINTSTITLTHESLEKFYNSLTAKKQIMELS